MAGVLQIVLGIIGAGVIGYVFPMAVIKGMLAAIGIILILKQIPHAFGYDADFQGDEAFRQANSETTFSSLATAFERIHPGAITLSVLSLVVLVLWDRPAMRRFKLMPGPLIVVVLATVLNAVFANGVPALQLSGDHLVTLPVARSVEEFAQLFVFPDWSGIGRWRRVAFRADDRRGRQPRVAAVAECDEPHRSLPAGAVHQSRVGGAGNRQLDLRDSSAGSR